jgi:hypothetical protein
MPITLDGTTGITTPGLINTGSETVVNLTTSGNTILGDVSTDTLNVGNGDLVKDASGNVGVGITPAYPFQVSRSNTTGGLEVANISLTGTQSADNYADLSFRLGNIGSRGAIVRAITNGGPAGNGHNLAFLTSANGATPTERMRIDSSGNVTIGTTTPKTAATRLTASIDSTRAYMAIESTTATGTDAIASFNTYTWNGSAQSLGLQIGSYYSLQATNPNSAFVYNTRNADLLFGTNNTERMRIDSAGNVGIGVTPESWFANTWAIELGNRYACIYSGSGQSSSPNIIITTNSYSKTGTGLDTYIATGFASKYTQANGNHFWYNAPSGTAENSITFTQAMTLDASGNLLVGITSAVSGGAGIQTADGITFPATAVASANANTLDDYEEGTFTPTVIGTTVAGTGTYVNQVGRYTRIGNRVCFTIYLNWTAHTGTGSMRVSGLPISSIATTASFHALSIWNANITLTASNLLQAYVNVNATTIDIQQYPTGGGASTAVTMDIAASLMLTGHYETT